MKNIFNTLLGFAIIGYLSFVVVNVIKIFLKIDGITWHSMNGHFIFIAIGSAILLIGYFSEKENKKKDAYAIEDVTKNQSEPKMLLSNEVPILKLIITASEETCSFLAKNLLDHDLVIGTFEDSGNWYTNGETGPEWFTVSIHTFSKNRAAIDALVDEKVKEFDLNVFNRFWSN